MSLINLLSLFGAMLLVAIIPGPAVFTIVAGSFSAGFSRGLYLAIGMICADYIFIIFALFGLSALSTALGDGFVVIKYVSAGYLMWLGYKLLRAKASSVELEVPPDASLWTNFLTGLLITLGNPKAILFYVGFFPAFVEFQTIVITDILLIMAVATVAFFGVNLSYALLAAKAAGVFKSPKASMVINKTAGTIMISTSLLVGLRA